MRTFQTTGLLSTTDLVQEHLLLLLFSMYCTFFIFELIFDFIGFAETGNPCNLNDNDVEIMKQHYKLLDREMNKKKPNVEIINSYPDKQFNTRREWLKIIPAEERCHKILKDYPCFTDHVEVQYKI